MQKLILGIIAIICLHLGFAAYMTTDKQADATANSTLLTNTTDDFDLASNSLNGLIETSRSPDPVQMNSESTDVAIEKNAPIEPDERSERKPLFQKRDERVRVIANKKDYGMPLRIDSRPDPNLYALLRPVVIKIKKPYPVRLTKSYSAQPSKVYPVQMLADSKSQTSESSVRKMRKSDRKSFVSILKKPYDWIKAIGSKMF